MSVNINLNGVQPSPVRESMANANKAPLATTTELFTTATLTAPRVVTMQAASNFPAGREFIFVDEFGGINSANTVTFNAAGADTINGAASLVFGTTNGVIRFVSDGVSKLTASVQMSSGPAAAGTLTGTTLASNVVNSSLTSVGTLTNLTVTNPISGNITGNAATVTTNANLTGPITSAGNATSIASQTGTGTTFAMSVSPALTGTPTVPTAAPGTNTTQTASTAFIINALSGYQTTLSVASVPTINTGTNNSDYTTSLGLEGSKYIAQKMTKISTSTSGTNTYTATLTPAITSYGGIGLYVNFTNANTVTNPTLAVDGLSADGFVQADGSAIMIGVLKGIVHIKHNGTAWQLVGRVVGSTPGSVAAGDDVRIKGYCLYNFTPTFNPADGISYYFGAVPTVATNYGGFNSSARRVYIPKSGTITRVQITVMNATSDGSSENATFYIRINDTTDYLVTNTFQFIGGAAIAVMNITGLSIPVVTGDYEVTKLTCPTWATNPIGSNIQTIIYIE